MVQRSGAGIRSCAKLTIGLGAAAGVLLIGGGALWWRLASGPIMLDLVTPWLTSAIAQKFGDRYQRRGRRHAARARSAGAHGFALRDIMLRNAAGALVATAPKAEVGIAGTSLLLASPRAERFRLVDAKVTLRVDPDGRVNVMVGGERPFVSIAPAQPVQPVQSAEHVGAVQGQATPAEPRREASSAPPARSVAAGDFGTWHRSQLRRAGSPGSTASRDDAPPPAAARCGRLRRARTVRNRHHEWQSHHRRPPQRQEWQLKNISLSLMRPKEGGAALPCCRKTPSGRGR